MKEPEKRTQTLTNWILADKSATIQEKISYDILKVIIHIFDRYIEICI